MALVASSRATSCGVQTTTAPVTSEQLRERNGHVAGARRHVDHEVVQVAPGRVADELRQAPVQHRPPPHDRFPRRDQETHREDLHAGGFDGLDLAFHQPRRLVDAEEVRHAGAVDVGVHQADLGPAAGQAAGEIRGDRALSHAAFARPHGNHALGRQPELARGFGRAAVLLDLYLDCLAGEAALEQRAQFIADFVPQRRRPSGQPEGHGELAVAKLDLVDLLELHGTAAGFGILETGKGVADGGFGDRWGHDGPEVGFDRSTSRTGPYVIRRDYGQDSIHSTFPAGPRVGLPKSAATMVCEGSGTLAR